MAISAVLLGLALASLVSSAAVAATPAPSTCGVTEQVARVLRLRRLDGTSPSGTVFRQSAGNRTRTPLGAGDELCAGDVIENPNNSNTEIDWAWAGQRQLPIPPGARIPVRPVGFLDHGKQWADTFTAYFSRRKQQTPVSSPVSRGACRYLPSVNPPARIAAAPAWGEMKITWRCEESAAEIWEVTVQPNTGAGVIFTLNENLLALDLMTYCTDGCKVAIRREPGTRPEVEFTVEARTPQAAGLPAWIDADADDPLSIAARGAWLSGPDAPAEWRVQGASLLLNVGCRVPVAGDLASRVYGITDIGDLCP